MDWLTQHQDNMSEWGHGADGLVSQWGSTIKTNNVDILILPSCGILLINHVGGIPTHRDAGVSMRVGRHTHTNGRNSHNTG